MHSHWRPRCLRRRPPPRWSDFGKYPDLKGQWLRPPAARTIGCGLPAFRRSHPSIAKIWEDIQADLKAGGAGNWPSTFCIPAGMPAMMSFYDPMEIIVMPETTYILISHNDDSYRRIYTDGRDWPAEAAPTFAGYSIGKWIDEDGDGKYDVLEVETRDSSRVRAVTTSRACRFTATTRPSSRSGSISTRPTATLSMTRSPCSITR